MFKWILWAMAIYWIIWWIFAVNSSYKPISEQIDVKTMSLRNPDYITKKWNNCSGSCRNYSSSSSSSRWGGSYGGK